MNPALVVALLVLALLVVMGLLLRSQADHPLALHRQARHKLIEEEPEAAGALLERALARLEARGEVDSELGFQVLNDLAVVHHQGGRSAEAERAYRRAIAAGEAIRGPEWVILGRTLGSLANLVAARDRDEAAALFDRSWEITAGALEQLAAAGEVPHEAASALGEQLDTIALDLGVGGCGSFERARERHEQAMELKRRHLGEDDPEVTLGHYHLALLFAKHDRPDEAAAAIETLISSRDALCGPESLTLFITLQQAIPVLEQVGRTERARELQARLDALAALPEEQLIENEAAARERSTEPADPA